MDGAYVTPDGKETSFYTLHLYLNENPSGGGATTFHSFDMKREFNVEPKPGRVLIFQHRSLLHSGADVTAGIKYTLRTDLMYRKVGPNAENWERVHRYLPSKRRSRDFVSYITPTLNAMLYPTPCKCSYPHIIQLPPKSSFPIIHSSLHFHQSHLPSPHPVLHRSSHLSHSNTSFPNFLLTSLCASHIHLPNSPLEETLGSFPGLFIHS